jgi:hypothetical protein
MTSVPSGAMIGAHRERDGKILLKTPQRPATAAARPGGSINRGAEIDDNPFRNRLVRAVFTRVRTGFRSMFGRKTR